MPVIVNNKKILPAPLVTFEKNIELSDDGRFLGSSYSVNFDGTILQNKGNPVAITGTNFSSSFSSDPWTSTQDPSDDPTHGVSESDLLISTITKIETLREALTPATGIKVEIVGFSNDKGLKFYGDLKNFTVNNDKNWSNPTSYSFSVGFNNFIESANSGLFPNGSSEDNFAYYVQSASDRWSIQESDQVVVNTGNFTQISKVYNVTRNLEAKGKKVYNQSGVVLLQPWQQASGYVISVLDTSTSSLPDSILGVTSGYSLTGRKIVENVDKLGGSYSIEESFIYLPSGLMPSGQYAIEDTSLSIEKSESSITTVNLQGTIAGIETNNPYTVSGTGVSKYTNAINYYNSVKASFYNRARLNSGLNWLHPKVKSFTEGRNPYTGQVTYSYNYDDRPPNLVPGSISEDISVNDTYPGQLFSATPVIGRNQPILQYLGSRSEYKRSLSINVFMERNWQNWSAIDVDASGRWTTADVAGVRYWFSQKPSITQTSYFQGIFDAINPANEVGVVASKCFYSAPQESWNPKTGNYSYNIEWTYERS